MKYIAIIHKSKYGYDVNVPALPGCHSQGKTKKEVVAKCGVKKVSGYLYFVDKKGNVSRAMMARGRKGGKKKAAHKKRAAPKKKAHHRKAAHKKKRM